MAIYLFSSEPGVVGAMVTGGAMPFAILMGGDRGVPQFPNPWVAKAILTGFRVNRKAGLGLTHTMMDRIYAHVFGEKAGVAVVSGLGFAGMCSTQSGYVGFDAVHAYFEDNNASAIGAPVRLVFGPKTALSGMMTDLDYTVEDPSTGLGSFTFQFRTFPRPKRAVPFLDLVTNQDNGNDPELTGAAVEGEG